MEERQSRLSNMDWKRFRPYLCVRLIPQNSMFSNFCHVLKIYKELDKLADEEHNALSWLCLYFRTFPMNGVNGFKSRTKLLVSKYDSF